MDIMELFLISISSTRVSPGIADLRAANRSFSLHAPLGEKTNPSAPPSKETEESDAVTFGDNPSIKTRLSSKAVDDIFLIIYSSGQPSAVSTLSPLFAV